jgi:beta-glucosidase
MGKEFYAKGANVQLGPGMCIARVPKNGRNFEYMSGEDPYLGYTLVKGAIDGIQSQGVIANAKHFVLNSEWSPSSSAQIVPHCCHSFTIRTDQETNRDSIDVQIDERTLYEIYMPPFKGAIDANVGSFMCS